MIEGRLKLNTSNNRYGLFGKTDFEYAGFHCGEGFEVFLEGKWIRTRIELNRTDEGNYWFLIDTPFYGNLENITARIER